MLYFDEELNQLVSVNNQKFKEGNEQYLSNIIIHLETFNYSTFKSITKGNEYDILKNKDFKWDFF